jgi:undecaprenyl diphosphate synthase
MHENADFSMVKHLACIMDGNRRWAVKQGLAASYGHRGGLDAVKRVIQFCLKKNISYLSLYTFSIENLNRSEMERNFLFGVVANEAAAQLEDLKKQNVRVRFIGDQAFFPENIKQLCEKVEKETAACDQLQLSFLLCYGGQQEIVDAAKRIAHEVKAGNIQESDITPKVFERFLWTASMPSPDLIIRTGGHQRLSNFLLYQAAYSELYFIEDLWPDITDAQLEMAISYFKDCRKNFGK